MSRETEENNEKAFKLLDEVCDVCRKTSSKQYVEERFNDGYLTEKKYIECCENTKCLSRLLLETIIMRNQKMAVFEAMKEEEMLSINFATLFPGIKV